MTFDEVSPQDAARMARAVGRSNAGAPELTEQWASQAGSALPTHERDALVRRQTRIRAQMSNREAGEQEAIARNHPGDPASQQRQEYARKLRLEAKQLTNR